MTIKSSGTQLGFGEIETEFGAQSPRSLGSYRHSQTVNGLTFNGIDAGVPTTGEIKFSDFYSKSLNIVVDCYSGSDEFRISAKNNKWNNNQIVIINPSTVSKKETGTKITIRVNKKFGSDKSSVNNCALKTGTWNNPASVIVDLGSSAKILGSGGNGGRGADGITNDGVDGGDGSSGLGIEHQGTIVNYRSGSVIRAGFGGGGGGGGGQETSKNDRRAGGGGGGGGAGFPFGTGGQGGVPQAGTRQANEDIGSPGGDGTETTGGGGGGGGDNDDQAGGQTGGIGGDNEQSPAAGPNDDSEGGAAGTNGAAIRESSGVSFTFNTTGGTIQPSSFTNAANAQQGVA
tara:strand:- start:1492 stop:2523 length:1032 start_codon:yes stop_codon:yes gene_type:complete